MAVNALEAKAHELLGRLDPGKLAVVVQLLEVMIDDDGDELTAEDRQAVKASREYFSEGNPGLSFEQIIAECGFAQDQIHSRKID